MGQDEIESILHMQWRPLHQGAPYIEDYYYQAYLFKYYGRRNRRAFAPESVRELAPTERVAADEVAFVRLEGLGKVPFFNVRRPRPLMDLAIPDDEGDKNEHAPGSRRLDQEPMLAARIMTEDCMALILDVQDIDRIFVAAEGRHIENETALRQRRTLLIDGLAASLRLPEAAVITKTSSSSGASSDGVFLRLLALPKGKNLAARALGQLYPPREAVAKSDDAMNPNLRILWAILRNVRALFGEQTRTSMSAPPAGSSKINAAAAAAAADGIATTSKVATAASDVLKRMHSPQVVCDALAAITSGDLDACGAATENPEAVLIPLFAPREHTGDNRLPWLCDVLSSLLQRAAEFELSSAAELVGAEEDAARKETAAQWRANFDLLYATVSRHVEALADAADDAKKEEDVEGVEEIKRLMPVSLVRSMLPHCSKSQEQALRAALTVCGT